MRRSTNSCRKPIRRMCWLRDTSRDGWPRSISVVGFAQSVHPVAMERGELSSDAVVERSVRRWLFTIMVEGPRRFQVVLERLFNDQSHHSAPGRVPRLARQVAEWFQRNILAR